MSLFLVLMLLHFLIDFSFPAFFHPCSFFPFASFGFLLACVSFSGRGFLMQRDVFWMLAGSARG
jgi:hypothetical protein